MFYWIRGAVVCILITLLFTAGCSKTDDPVSSSDNNTSTDNPQQYDTPFGSVPVTADICMYEVNERAFSTAGTLAGVTARLDNIKSLGVNVVWLMPLHPIGKLNSAGGLGSPYSVQNYAQVNTEFGTLADLRTLVKTAHAKGMAVIMDWVANHTAWDNPWIANRDWYTQNSSGAIISPAGTNWTDVADLNYNSMAMRAAMIKAMKYWILEANVDGYRCDAADMVPYDFWKQAIDSLKAIPGRSLIFLAEGTRADHYTAGFQLTYASDFYTQLKYVFSTTTQATAAGLYSINQLEYSNIPAKLGKLRFTSNHDEDAWNNTPLVYFNGKQGSLAAFVCTAFMGGSPLVYNGQEVGCPVMLPFFTKSPIDWSLNPDMLSEYQNLLNFRKANKAARQGTLTDYSSTQVCAFTRAAAPDTIAVIVNTRNQIVNYALPSGLAYSQWKNAVTGAQVNLSSAYNLQPYSYVILAK